VISRRIVIKYPARLIDKPVLCHLTRAHDLEFNILRAQVAPDTGGLMVLEISGEAAKYKAAMEQLESQGVSTQTLSRDIVWEEDRCTQCGLCVTLCPSGALASESGTCRVSFDAEKCVACEYCTLICPVHAMRVTF
jgi:L-aspartate semialdehyde sulfurtransferase ferredoxin